MVINDLLSNSFYRYNQTLLAEHLKVNRGTLRKYKDDLAGDKHIVRKENGSYILYAKLSERMVK